MVATGKGSKRSGKTIALEDSDDDEKQQQSAPRNIANKRRRTILEDDDDDDDDSDEVKIVSPNSRPATATRSTRSSRNSNSNDDVLHVDDNSVSDPPSTRRRSTRSSQELQQDGSEVDKYSKSKERTLSTNSSAKHHDKTDKGNEVDDAGLLKIPRKNVTTIVNDNGNDVAGKSSSIIKNADLLTLTPTKMSPVRNSKEPHQRHNQGTSATPVKNEKEGIVQSSTGVPKSNTTELSKEEKLQKFLESRQLKPNEQQVGTTTSINEYTHTKATNPSSTLPKEKIDTRAIEELRTICDHFKYRVNDESAKKNVRLDIQLSSRGRVDLFGSFICTDDNDARELDVRYDFFDTNSQGEIVLSRPQPMFPDEFPDHQPTHSAAWWGIVEPNLGVGKYRSQLQQSMYAPPSSNVSNAVAVLAQDQKNDKKSKGDEVVDRIDAPKNKGRDAGASDEIKSGHRSERIGSNRVDDRQNYNDRFPMNNTNDTRHFGSRDQRKERPTSHRNTSNHDASSSRNYGRR